MAKGTEAVCVEVVAGGSRVRSRAQGRALDEGRRARTQHAFGGRVLTVGRHFDGDTCQGGLEERRG